MRVNQKYCIMILLLGDPRLRKKAYPVTFPLNATIHDEKELLEKALKDFQREKGFGRAIAAPQIGIPKRFISLNFGDKQLTIFNPVIGWQSEDTFLLWDDCMSFPDLMVKIRRHSSISVVYQDEHGKEKVWEHLDPSTSELLQHEIDHLDGILAIDRAIDRESIVYRSVFEEKKRFFLNQIASS